MINALAFTWLDWLALSLLLGLWLAYTQYALKASHRRPCLMSALSQQRLNWMQQMARRENRIVDATVVGNQLRGVTFFASTTVLILAALLSLLAASEQTVQAVSSLPGFKIQSSAAWEFKTSLLLGFMIYAFFRFTWSLRQYKFLGVLVGATPERDSDSTQLQQHAQQAANIANEGAYAFNSGLRSYYYALAALTWFVNPLLLIASSLVVTSVLYSREFHSSIVSGFSKHS